MNSIFTKRRLKGTLAPYLVSSGNSVELDGMSVIGMPPGRVDVQVQMERDILNISVAGAKANDSISLNGEKRELATQKPGGVALFGAGSELDIRCDNLDWELLIEFDNAELRNRRLEGAQDNQFDQTGFAHGKDPGASVLAQFAIAHLREPIIDRIYLDGLITALAARSSTLSMTGHRPPSLTGTDSRIARAVHYIQEHLSEGMSIGELAAEASMSPSWFSRAFKGNTGKSVHAFILEKRLENAKHLLITTKDPISTIAYASGFADHSHLSRLVRRKYGVTPSDLRWS